MDTHALEQYLAKEISDMFDDYEYDSTDQTIKDTLTLIQEFIMRAQKYHTPSEYICEMVIKACQRAG